MSKTLRQDQRGIASILVTLIMMIVISLIVIGFAQVTRRNQREALDQQLSTQAFYAAETGVNDTVKLLKSQLSAGTSLSPKTDCANNTPYAGLTPTLSTDGVSYSCILVDPTPTSLLYTSIQEQRTTVVPITTNAALTNLTFKWGPDGTNTDASKCNDNNLALPIAGTATGNWLCSYGLLRVDLVKIDSAHLDAAGLDDRTVTFFLKPTTASVSNDVSTGAPPVVNGFVGGQRAYIVTTKCSGGSCSATINFGAGAQGTQYYARLSGMYHNVANLAISGQTSIGAATFSNAQVVVDSTGKAQDQLRRISVRVPLLDSNSDLLPNNLLQSAGAICKRYYIAPAVPSVPEVPTTPTPSMCID